MKGRAVADPSRLRRTEGIGQSAQIDQTFGIVEENALAVGATFCSVMGQIARNQSGEPGYMDWWLVADIPLKVIKKHCLSRVLNEFLSNAASCL